MFLINLKILKFQYVYARFINFENILYVESLQTFQAAFLFEEEHLLYAKMAIWVNKGKDWSSCGVFGPCQIYTCIISIALHVNKCNCSQCSAI